jgi:hypothetical protein
VQADHRHPLPAGAQPGAETRAEHRLDQLQHAAAAVEHQTAAQEADPDTGVSGLLRSTLPVVGQPAEEVITGRGGLVVRHLAQSFGRVGAVPTAGAGLQPQRFVGGVGVLLDDGLGEQQRRLDP